MAVREIRIEGDPILSKTSKEVREMTPRIKELIQDMWDTMYDADGVGLAAVQVGILRRIFVIDDYDGHKCVLINPVKISEEGEQEGSEGCLSVPGKAGKVLRPMKVVFEGLNEEMQPVRIEGEGLFARALCHENDHLDGHLYVEKAIGGVYDVEEEADGGETEE